MNLYILVDVLLLSTALCNLYMTRSAIRDHFNQNFYELICDKGPQLKHLKKQFAYDTALSIKYINNSEIERIIRRGKRIITTMLNLIGILLNCTSLLISDAT